MVPVESECSVKKKEKRKKDLSPNLLKPAAWGLQLSTSLPALVEAEVETAMGVEVEAAMGAEM
jgi:hypothetical protein